MSKVAAAITSPATKAAKQENSTKSLRSLWQKIGLEGIAKRKDSPNRSSWDKLS
jgi:hypothetical protein